MSQQKSVISKLLAAHCRPAKAGSKALPAAKITAYIRALSGWEENSGEISKTWSFENYYETMAFVNALAWISHEQDHHPDLEVGYNKCVVRYSTHSVGGLSANDFICVAKANSL